MNWIANDFAMTDLLPAATAAILAISQWYWNSKIKERDVEIDLQKQLTSILELTIKYPYLEDVAFTESWNDWKAKGCPPDELYMRYDQFCNILFNYLASLYRIKNGDEKEIEDFLDVKSWVRLHRQIWENPRIPAENVDGYSKEFRRYINDFLK